MQVAAIGHCPAAISPWPQGTDSATEHLKMFTKPGLAEKEEKSADVNGSVAVVVGNAAADDNEGRKERLKSLGRMTLTPIT